MNAIETNNLRKSFEGIDVLRGVNLRVPSGTMYGLVGPNGVGKSTLMRLLLGFLRPDSGTLRVLGAREPERVLGRIGYLPERMRYHLRYSGREYLRFFGQFNDMREPQLSVRVADELRFFGLASAADRRLDTYSKGMLQRIGIAQTLLNDPELVLIDEPTSGLDPASQREMMDLLVSVRERGHTILLTTHMLHEIEQACDYVGILANGTIAFETDVAALRQPSRSIAISVPPLPDEVTAQLLRLSPAVRYTEREITIEPNSMPLQASVLRLLLDMDIPVIALVPRRRPLEDIYTRVVNGEVVEPLVSPTPATASAPELPPNGMFAPPGHPDALLRELLHHDQDEAR